MDHGEPPGRLPDEERNPDSQPQVAQQGQKPVRIDVSFSHEETLVAGKRMLLKPFGDLAYEATVLTLTGDGNGKVRKTIGVLMGPNARPSNGLMRYEATVSASPENAELVRERLRDAMEELQRRYKAGFSDVLVEFASTRETTVTREPGATLELSHETPDRDGERGQNDRDLSGAEQLFA